MIKRKLVLKLVTRKSRGADSVILITQESGIEKEEFIFGPICKKIKAPGKYDLSYSQNRMGYWVISDISPVIETKSKRANRVDS